jgi:phenylpropionate dioxygenase-like ring-hydroxylating dioxygenase large terminal subunit
MDDVHRWRAGDRGRLRAGLISDLLHGMGEAVWLRCNYDGWAFNANGQCISRPIGGTCFPERVGRPRVPGG